MTDLLSRLRAAQEGNRELSDEVLVACGWGRANIALWSRPDGSLLPDDRLPDPSRSIDHAVALVPEGWHVCTGWWLPDAAHFALMPLEADTFRGNRSVEGSSATPALALCIAVLEARQGGEKVDAE